ncbi:hypothetical protein CCAX7_59810 [Capsulimonas corticalis]|uniref:Uncharacterized protein n=1 Tax=Capsulimonas corticalis TaxID=2219043 RepID=A0A9N7LDN3_9BACT|nr:hypothetical protein [Capsulimonas corticalis]BDI33930.1 hypothetical protein CCAX7_59810 [Capsulimonas corticalis]
MNSEQKPQIREKILADPQTCGFPEARAPSLCDGINLPIIAASWRVTLLWTTATGWKSYGSLHTHTNSTRLSFYGHSGKVLILAGYCNSILDQVRKLLDKAHDVTLTDHR